MKRVLAGLLVLATIAAAIWAWRHYANQTHEMAWQGWIEGNFLFIAPDEAGRVVNLRVKEGDKVARGAPLFAVEDELQASEAEQAKASLEQAKAQLDRAEAAQQRPQEIAVLEAQKKQAEAALEKSKPEFTRTKKLVAKGFSPQSSLDAASAAYARDQAALIQINRQIDVARLKARSEDIAAARAVVGQAQSRLTAANVSLKRRIVTAPAASRVQEVFYREGEVVPAARPVLSLLPPGNVKLRFFVPETELALVSPGSKVRASCDGCDNAIEATVSFVSTENEFTPPVIFSKEERQKLVFRVEAIPDDPIDLRVGLPITVTLAGKDDAHVPDSQ